MCKELTIHFRCKSHIIAINENLKLLENCYRTLQISISSFQLKTCNCEIGVDKLIWFKWNSRLVEVINNVANVYKHEWYTIIYFPNHLNHFNPNVLIARLHSQATQHILYIYTYVYTTQDNNHFKCRTWNAKRKTQNWKIRTIA